MNKWFLNSIRRIDVILFTLSVIIFVVWPQLDIRVSNSFYDSNSHTFIGADSDILFIIYRIFAYIQFPLLIGLIYNLFRFKHKAKHSLRKKCLYLMCCLIIGPGLLVNIVLKDNSFGRPRPKQIETYGGELDYSAPFVYSGECRKNCSFTSGHAAIGFLLIALAWTTRRRVYFVGGILLGSLLGLMRIAQGAHFPSDIVFSFWVIYTSSLLLSTWFKLKIGRQPVLALN